MKDDRTPRRKRKRSTNATFPVDSSTNTGYAIGAVPQTTGSVIAPPPVTFVDDSSDGCFECKPMKIFLED